MFNTFKYLSHLILSESPYVKHSDFKFSLETLYKLLLRNIM